jgi:predicted metal-dependent hydrolase
MKPTRNIVKPTNYWNPHNKLSIWAIKNDDKDLGADKKEGEDFRKEYQEWIKEDDERIRIKNNMNKDWMNKKMEGFGKRIKITRN